MRKTFIYLAIIAAILLLLIGAMFASNICPPVGPWPTPPWCRGEFIVHKYEVSVSPSPLPQIKAVNMYDTWGRNYNMGMFETTQANIESSFERVRTLGAKEIFIHDFDRALYDDETDYKSTSYQLADETFWNDMRDESINSEDLEKLVEAAHSRGMKLGIKRNLAFVNIGKFILSGIKGDITTDVAKDYEDFNSSHTEEWISNYFEKWESRLSEKGKMYQEAGVDIMSISPMFQDPTFTRHEELANRLWKKLISKVKENFKGEIMTDLNIYGFIDGKNGKEDWTKYDYYKEADVIEIKIYAIPGKYKIDGEESFDAAMGRMIEDVNRKAIAKGIKVSLFFAPSSYTDGTFAGPVEYLDSKNPSIRALESDYNEQAKAFNSFFSVVRDATNIVRINVGNFAWDDALDPEVRPLISISAGFRNKPSEEVVKAWFLK